MSDYVWPSASGVPSPSSLEFTPAMRLRTSDLGGLTAAAAQQRDFRGTEQVGLVLTALEAEALEAWHLVVLRNGGMSWRATWPTPAGWSISHVRKFTSPISWQREAGAIFRASFTTELLGRFAAGLTGAYDVPSLFDGTWEMDGSRYLYKFVRPT